MKPAIYPLVRRRVERENKINLFDLFCDGDVLFASCPYVPEAGSQGVVYLYFRKGSVVTAEPIGMPWEVAGAGYRGMKEKIMRENEYIGNAIKGGWCQSLRPSFTPTYDHPTTSTTTTTLDTTARPPIIDDIDGQDEHRMNTY